VLKGKSGVFIISGSKKNLLSLIDGVQLNNKCTMNKCTIGNRKGKEDKIFGVYICFTFF
jgi:hypothetical protein